MSQYVRRAVPGDVDQGAAGRGDRHRGAAGGALPHASGWRSCRPTPTTRTWTRTRSWGSRSPSARCPGHFDSANFSLLCAGLLLLPLIKRIGTGAPWARNLALVLSAAGGLNTLGSLAVPSPWWYYVLTVVMVALTGVVIVLLWRTPVIEDYQERHDAEVARATASSGDRLISVRSRLGAGWVTAADCRVASRA